jgi:hypothetical protein
MKTTGKAAMDDQVRQLAEQLLKTGFDQLSALAAPTIE